MGNIVAIVGRPNVGKSTLFNRLTQTRQAIVNEEAGTTRDRQYGKAEWTGKEFSLIDTGGWVINSDDVFEEEINKQVKVALEEADVILFVVDVLNGVTDLDNEVAAILRRAKKPVIVVANKADNFELHPSSAEFYSFGLGDPFCISAINGSCTGDLLDKIVATLPDDKQEMLEEELPRIAIIGRPNAGKSSLINAFIGEGAINVTCLDPTAEIHYTTDGSTPTLQSPIYEGPIKVTETTDFTFCTFRPNGKKGDIVKTRFIKSEYTPSVTAAPSNPGLKATWHEFKGNKCSEIEKAPVNGTYPVEDVMIPKKVKGNIGLIIKGYFNAPQDDIYTFALLSDDGSTLTIDSEQIVDNDGPHGPKEIVGQKALAKGYHPMELRYFDQNGGQLKLKVTGSDGKEIPFTHLYAH